MQLTADQWAVALGLTTAQVRKRLRGFPKTGDGWSIGVAARVLLDAGEQMKPSQRVAWLRSELKRIGLSQADGAVITVHEYTRRVSEILKAFAQLADTLPDVLESESRISPGEVDAVIRVVDTARNRAADRVAGRDPDTEAA